VNGGDLFRPALAAPRIVALAIVAALLAQVLS